MDAGRWVNPPDDWPSCDDPNDTIDDMPDPEDREDFWDAVEMEADRIRKGE